MSCRLLAVSKILYMKNILYFNSTYQPDIAVSYLSLSSEKDFFLHLHTAKQRNLPWFCRPERQSSRSLTWKNKLLSSAAFFWLLWRKLAKKTDTLILAGYPEKFLFTKPAKLMKIKVFWLELPGETIQDIAFLRNVSRLAKGVKVIAFSEYGKNLLAGSGIDPDNISVVRPGLDLDSHLMQDDIFHGLAKNDNGRPIRKFFTIGTHLDMDDREEIEYILQSAKKALEYIPNLQIIIIGEGPLSPRQDPWVKWLTKQMGIDNLIWFVGENTKPRKWLDNLDIYVVTPSRPNYSDISYMLEAIACGKPIIGPRDAGLEEIIFDHQLGRLIAPSKSEELAKEIIDMEQNQEHLKSYKEKNVAWIKQYGNIAKNAKLFSELILK